MNEIEQDLNRMSRACKSSVKQKTTDRKLNSGESKVGRSDQEFADGDALKEIAQDGDCYAGVFHKLIGVNLKPQEPQANIVFLRAKTVELKRRFQ